MRKQGLSVLALTLMGFFALSVSNALAQSDSVQLRYQWNPGDKLTYRTTMNIEASAEGLRVLTISGQEEITLEVDKSSSNRAELVFYQGDVRVLLTILGQELNILVTKDRVTTTLNGGEPPYDLSEQLKQDLAPLQRLMRTSLLLTITDQGKVLKVSGLEVLDDEEMQREFASSFMEGIEVPSFPLRVGESYTQSRNLAAFLPQTPGSQTTELPAQKVDIQRKLAAIESGERGERLARIEGRFSQTLRDLPLTEEGGRGDFIPNIDIVTWFDCTNGRITKELVTGSIRIIPRDDTPPITMEMRVEIMLVK